MGKLKENLGKFAQYLGQNWVNWYMNGSRFLDKIGICMGQLLSDFVAARPYQKPNLSTSPGTLAAHRSARSLDIKKVKSKPKLKSLGRSAHLYFLSIWARLHSVIYVVGYATPPAQTSLFYLPIMITCR